MFHRCHQLGEYKLYFNLIFSVSSFSCFSPDFAGPVSTSWRRIWRNERIFLYRMWSYKITSSRLCTSFTAE
jgi:hypothetical protein